ncbi:GAF domain-containing protein [Luteolibacter arcticus]|uniref:GAF domain-containing protein n=1 Tax=Luteolibacter arcticus TaxID=1581411 RepID=A0ABT3GMM3_9BACT|nr:GAF domain-containing protein [Luteolibacter arcticus]MCW1924765.1 GAF domain-containing protein [Luteolibacter arcticus]
MTADLEDTRLLQDLGARLVDEDNIDAIYQEILAAAITLTRADAGVVQILDPASGDLSVLAAKGFEEDLVVRFQRVDANSPTSCGLALRSNQRAYIDFDTPGESSPALGLLSSAGFRSAQSTPLTSRAGTLIGMLTTHWHHRHRLEDRQLQFLDLLARQAADLILHRQLEQTRRAQEDLLAADLADSKQLQQISSRLLVEDELDAIYSELVDAAIILVKADAGSLQRFDAEADELELLSWRGFASESAISWQRVRTASGGAAGIALKEERRIVIPDIGSGDSPLLPDAVADYSRSNLRAVQATPLMSRSGKPLGILSTYWRQNRHPTERDLRLLDIMARQAADLIERRTAEDALRDSERRYRALFDSIDEGFCTVEMIFDAAGHPTDYRFLQVNPSFVRLTGITDAVGRTMREISSDHEEHWFESYGRIARTGQPERFVAQAQQLQRWYDVYALRVDDPALGHVAVLFNDVTRRVQTEEQLRQAHDVLESRVKERTHELASTLKRLQDEVEGRKKIERERRELLQRIVHLQEAERARVARELHDNLGQHMVAVLMHLEGFQRRLSQSGDDAASYDLSEFRKVVDVLIKATHRQSWELRPAELDELGLEVAIDNYIFHWSETTGIPVDFRAESSGDRQLEPEQMIALYRVTQEALTNVARHAHATHIDIELDLGRPVCVSIRDNGVGFDPAKIKRRLGLLGMQERLDIAGGTLTIQAASQRGTCIRACIP